MKSAKTALLLLLLMAASPLAADLLQVDPGDRALLGIVVQTPALAAAAGTAEITLRADFAPDGEWAVKSPFSGILHRVWVQVATASTRVTPWSRCAARRWSNCSAIS